VQGQSQSPTSPAIVANWTGPSNSPAPHSGVYGSGNAGPGVHGSSASLGVLGKAAAVGPGEPTLTGGIGVRGESGSGPGVLGSSIDRFGVRGVSQSFPGVFGTSEERAGVQGRTAGGNVPGVAGVVGVSVEDEPQLSGPDPDLGNGTGVRGVSGGGIGVQGIAETGRGLVGQSSGIALDVIGKAQFSTSGSGSAPWGPSSYTVANANVTAQSHIAVTITSNSGPQ
jgi:hypothetical protein